MERARDTRLSFGAKVREYRHHKGWTLLDLAMKLGKTETSVSRLERGKQNITLDQILQIAELLDVSVADLFRSLPAPPPGNGSLRLYVESLAQRQQTWHDRLKTVVQEGNTLESELGQILGMCVTEDEEVPYFPAAYSRQEDCVSVFSYVFGQELCLA